MADISIPNLEIFGLGFFGVFFVWFEVGFFLFLNAAIFCDPNYSAVLQLTYTDTTENILNGRRENEINWYKGESKNYLAFSLAKLI